VTRRPIREIRTEGGGYLMGSDACPVPAGPYDGPDGSCSYWWVCDCGAWWQWHPATEGTRRTPPTQGHWTKTGPDPSLRWHLNNTVTP